MTPEFGMVLHRYQQEEISATVPVRRYMDLGAVVDPGRDLGLKAPAILHLEAAGRAVERLFQRYLDLILGRRRWFNVETAAHPSKEVI